VSRAPYDTANLSTAVADGADAVARNRRRLAGTLGLADPEAWWWLRQVHGAGVVVADGAAPREPPAADAIVTRSDGPIVVLTADCAPLLLACDDALGVVHAGWRGLLAGVIESAVEKLRDIGRGEVRAVLGPCIHAERYEFGEDDLEVLIALLGPEVDARTASGARAFDLPAGVRLVLDRVGVSAFLDVDVCTAASSDHFSARRDGETGRQALVAVLAP
jgi:polyphenol oxidase